MVYANLPLLLDTVDNKLEVFGLRASPTVAALDDCVDLSEPPPALTLVWPVMAVLLPARPVPWCRWLCLLAQVFICLRSCSLSTCRLGR